MTRERIVLLTLDARTLRDLWITRDYFPETITLDQARFPRVDRRVDLLSGAVIETVAMPRECSDGFGISHWGRPEAILDP